MINQKTINVIQGECVVTDDDHTTLTTVLGSCIAACIYDRETGIGGMNHFLLPSNGAHSQETCLRFGCYAMEALINEVLKKGSGKRHQLVAKVFGGANVSAYLGTIGQDNAAFVETYLMKEGLQIAAKDLGGQSPRKVLFHPHTGRAFVKHVNVNAEMLATEELSQAKTTMRQHAEPEIELF